MYSIILNGIKQHEIINGYNNRSKNDKTCCECHKIFPYNYIVSSIQKEVNLEAILLRGPEIIINAKFKLYQKVKIKVEY